MRLTERSKNKNSDMVWFKDTENEGMRLEPCELTAHHNRMLLDKLAAYEDAEEQGRYIKLPEKVEETEYRECVHTRTKCHHENCKCSECPLTELFCDEFYTAIDRCYEDAYAKGCLAGIELGKAEAKLEEMRCFKMEITERSNHDGE